jgi:hypothetical protein
VKKSFNKHINVRIMSLEFKKLSYPNDDAYYKDF